MDCSGNFWCHHGGVTHRTRCQEYLISLTGVCLHSFLVKMYVQFDPFLFGLSPLRSLVPIWTSTSVLRHFGPLPVRSSYKGPKWIRTEVAEDRSGYRPAD